MIEQKDIPTFEDTDKRETNFHNFDEQKEVTGKLKAIVTGEYGDQYLLETAQGEVTIGTYDVLKSKIQQTDVGKWVKIVYKGFIPSKKNPRMKYKDFDVFIK